MMTIGVAGCKGCDWTWAVWAQRVLMGRERRGQGCPFGLRRVQEPDDGCWTNVIGSMGGGPQKGMSSGSSLGKISENVSGDGCADDGAGDDIELGAGVVNDDGGAEVGERSSNEEGMLEGRDPIDAGSIGHGDEGSDEVVGDWGLLSHGCLLT